MVRGSRGKPPPSQELCLSTNTPPFPSLPLALAPALLGGVLKTASSQKEFYHYTSYAMVAGIPASFLLGAPVSTVVDLACGAIIPLHAHLGMRSVIVDYVHEQSTRDAILMALAAFTVGSIGGLTYFNATDVGLTKGIKALFVKQTLA